MTSLFSGDLFHRLIFRKMFSNPSPPLNIKHSTASLTAVGKRGGLVLSSRFSPFHFGRFFRFSRSSTLVVAVFLLPYSPYVQAHLCVRVVLGLLDCWHKQALHHFGHERANVLFLEGLSQKAVQRVRVDNFLHFERLCRFEGCQQFLHLAVVARDAEHVFFGAADDT